MKQASISPSPQVRINPGGLESSRRMTWTLTIAALSTLPTAPETGFISWNIPGRNRSDSCCPPKSRGTMSRRGGMPLQAPQVFRESGTCPSPPGQFIQVQDHPIRCGDDFPAGLLTQTFRQLCWIGFQHASPEVSHDHDPGPGLPEDSPDIVEG